MLPFYMLVYVFFFGRVSYIVCTELKLPKFGIKLEKGPEYIWTQMRSSPTPKLDAMVGSPALVEQDPVIAIITEH